LWKSKNLWYLQITNKRNNSLKMKFKNFVTRPKSSSNAIVVRPFAPLWKQCESTILALKKLPLLSVVGAAGVAAAPFIPLNILILLAVKHGRAVAAPLNG